MGKGIRAGAGCSSAVELWTGMCKAQGLLSNSAGGGDWKVLCKNNNYIRTYNVDVPRCGFCWNTENGVALTLNGKLRGSEQEMKQKGWPCETAVDHGGGFQPGAKIK